MFQNWMNTYGKQHKILWEGVDIVGRKNNIAKQKILEASFIVVNEGRISQASKEVSKIWLKGIRELVPWSTVIGGWALLSALARLAPPIPTTPVKGM